MNLYQTFTTPSPMNNFYPQRALSPNIQSYDEYFNKKLRQKQSQRRHQESSSIVSKKNHSKNSMSRVKSSKQRKSTKKVKKSPKEYIVDPMYASRVSQMASEISIPTHETKIKKKELARLQGKIISEILSLREQKITALESLNHIVDKKNKAIELLKGFQVLKETQKLNAQEGIIQENPAQSKLIYDNNYSSPYNYKNSHYKSSSRLSKKSNYPAQVMNSRLSKEINQLENALLQASKIKDELMKPLIEHPLLLKNNELKAELQQLQQQLNASHLNKPNITQEINHYRTQNQKLTKQLQRLSTKLSSIQHKRFQTFFPKDKQRIDEIRKLIDLQKKLQQRKQQLQEELLNGTIIRKAEDEIMIQELKEENRRLIENCERLEAMGMGRTQGSSVGQYERRQLDELQGLVVREMQNKRILDEMMVQFREKINELERQNQTMIKRKTRTSYY